MTSATGRACPFLRWAGGKRKLVTRLVECLPADVRSRRYWEPFLGAGAVYFAVQPSDAVISDANQFLVQCYDHVKRNPDGVYAHLRQHAQESCEGHYYAVRDDYNRSRRFTPTQAARFIYLNNTCFNGIFRVNTRGEFNVPYGHKDPPKLPTRDELRGVSATLQCAELEVGDFEQVLAPASAGDFVYLDPPYPPLNGTAYFTHYTADRFGVDDQRRLAGVVADLDARGCVVMMTNADTPLIRELYAQFSQHELSVTRYVTCKKQKHRVSELVITNYVQFEQRLWGPTTC